MGRDLIGSIDCGTTSSRFIIFDETANVLATHQVEFKQHYPKPGWMEESPDELVQTCYDVVEGAIKTLEAETDYKKSDIKGVGITNQRETTVVWSRKTGKALYNAIVWPDTRNTHTIRQLAKTSAKGVDALRETTGLPLSTYFAGCKLKWLLDNVKEVKRAHDEGDLMFGTVDTWLLYAFTGGRDGGLFYTDITNASRTMFMNLKTLDWDDEALHFFGVDKRCLATIVSNAEVYGKFKSGALQGVPIAGMLGDQQAALVGQKCFSPGESKNTYGTGCFMLYNTGENVTPSNHGLLTTTGYKAGKDAKAIYALEGSIAVGGSSIKWLRDQLGLIKEASEVGDLAGQVKDTGGVYFVTAFSGLFAPYWDDSASGTLVGITGYTDKRHIARATIEATCYQTKAILYAMMADSKQELAALKVDGGMTNSDVAMQIQADILGIEVDRPEMRESTALGSAIMAGITLKLFGWDVDKPESFDKVNVAGKTVFKPKWSKQERGEKYKGWERAVERSKGWNQDSAGADPEASKEGEQGKK